MEGLRPDRDELDQFKHRATRGSKKTAAPAAAQAPAAARKSPVGLWFFIIILVAVCGFLGFGLWQQQEAVSQLRKQINDTEGFVGQSKLLMARLEGELNETGEVMEQSGSAVDKKLAFLDSEMRKLWGVSNDRNKKAIQENEASLAALEERIASVRSGQAAIDKKLDKVASGNETLLRQLREELQALDKRVSLAASEASILRDAHAEELVAIKAGLKAVQATNAKVAENEKSIASINASRRQLNERVVGLERQLNQLQSQQKATVPLVQ